MVTDQKDFFGVCNQKIDHIILELETLKRDMSDKYKRLGFQFKIIAVTTGACLGILLHQMIVNAMSIL